MVVYNFIDSPIFADNIIECISTTPCYFTGFKIIFFNLSIGIHFQIMIIGIYFHNLISWITFSKTAISECFKHPPIGERGLTGLSRTGRV